MKKSIDIFLVLIFSSILVTSCANNDASKNEYFGFNNKPVIADDNSDNYSYKDYDRKSLPEKKVEKQWINPLTDEYSDSYAVSTVNYYPSQVFVPVIIPWWDYYYRPHFNYYYRYPSWYHLSYYYDPFWDDYYYWRWDQPYIGHRWCWNHYNYYPWDYYSHNYYSYPVAPRENKYRNFGSNRGYYASGSSRSGDIQTIGSTSRGSRRSDIKSTDPGVPKVQFDRKPESVQNSARGSRRSDVVPPSGNSNTNSTNRSNLPKSDVSRPSQDNGSSRNNNTYTPPSNPSNGNSGNSNSGSSRPERGSRKKEIENVQFYNKQDIKRNDINRNFGNSRSETTHSNKSDASFLKGVGDVMKSMSSPSNNHNSSSRSSNSGGSSHSTTNSSSSKSSSSSTSSGSSSSRGSSRSK